MTCNRNTTTWFDMKHWKIVDVKNRVKVIDQIKWTLSRKYDHCWQRRVMPGKGQLSSLPNTLTWSFNRAKGPNHLYQDNKCKTTRQSKLLDAMKHTWQHSVSKTDTLHRQRGTVAPSRNNQQRWKCFCSSVRLLIYCNALTAGHSCSTNTFHVSACLLKH